MLTLQCILQLQTGMLVRGRSWVPPLPSQGAALPSDPHFHVLLKPHEGLAGDHIAGGADSLPFVDGPLPLLLRGHLQGKARDSGEGQELPDDRNAKHRTQSPHSVPVPMVQDLPPSSRLGLCLATQQPLPEAWWVIGAGTSLLTALVEGLAPFSVCLQGRALLFLGPMDAGFVFCLGQPCANRQGEGRCQLRVWPQRVSGP